MQPKLPLPAALISAHAARVLPLIERFASEKKLHHSILFTGLNGVGKRETVTHFIQTLFCDQSVFAAAKEEEGGDLFGGSSSSLNPSANGTSPCGACASCIRAKDNQWIDLYWFEPESASEDKLGTHKIDAFRELKTKMGFAPTEEPFKVVVIADADRMNLQTANSILKILEEPPPSWVFILTASDATTLLPTLVSRCIEVRLSPLAPEQIFESLKEIQGSHFQSRSALVASRAGMGSVVRAQNFLDEDLWKLRELILGLISNPASDWLKLVDQLAVSQRHYGLGLDLLESIFSDLMQYKIRGKNYAWIHDDQKDFLSQWLDSRTLSASFLAETIAKITEHRRHAGRTLNAKLLAQDTLIPVLQTLIS